MTDDSLLDRFVFDPAPRVPVPTFADDDAPLANGDVVVFPAQVGKSISLVFAGPFEAFLRLDERRVRDSSTPEGRRLAIWMGRNLPALYRALEHEKGLLAVLGREGVRVLDVIDLEDESALDHVGLRRTLTGCRVALPPMAVLGPVSSRAELQSRIRTIYASGTLLEVRVEESGRCIERHWIRVGR